MSRTLPIQQKTPTPLSFNERDKVDDDILNSILMMIEYFAILEKKDFKSLYSKKDVSYSLDFLYNRIDVLEGYQTNFKLKPCTDRFARVSRFLDNLTLEKYYPNFTTEFSVSVSLLLDVLYTSVLQTSVIMDYFLQEDLKDFDDN